MRKIIFTTTCILVFVFNLKSQVWYMTRGLSTDEVAWGVDTDPQGNVYWAIEEKNQWPFWYYNIILFKFDASGQLIWQSEPYGGDYNEIAFKVTVNDTLVFLSGRADSNLSPVSGDAMVLCYNANNGDFIWPYQYSPVPDYGYEEIDGLVVQPDGIYTSGWLQQAGTNDEDFLIQKIDYNGQLVWTNSWDYEGMNRFDGANGHMEMDNNYLYVVGHVNRSNIGSLDGDGALVCFSRDNGAYQWHVTWGGSLYDDALGMTMGGDSMLYMVGFTGSYGNGSQTYINKYNRSGQLIWNRIWGGTGTEDCRSAVMDGDSILYVVGATSSYSSGGKDIFVLKFDTAGTLIDSLFWGGPYDEGAQDVAISNGYLYITGETQSFGNGQINGDQKTDGILLKINGRLMQAPDTSMSLQAFTKSQNEGNPVIIFPNPFNKNVYIKLSDEKYLDSDLEIYNVSGKIVFTEKINSGVTRLSPSLPAGIYFYIVKNRNEIISRGKIVGENIM